MSALIAHCLTCHGSSEACKIIVARGSILSYEYRCTNPACVSDDLDIYSPEGTQEYEDPRSST